MGGEVGFAAAMAAAAIRADRRAPARSRARDLLPTWSATCWSTAGPASRVQTLIEALGDGRPRVLALTHIHLDHAGRGRHARRALARPRGLGARARRAAPGRPQQAARERDAALRRRHGAAVGRVPRGAGRRTCACCAGESDSDGFEVAYTPGPRLPSRQLLAPGDAHGVRRRRRRRARRPAAATCSRRRRRPTSIVELWRDSIERLRSWRPRARSRSRTSASSATSPRTSTGSSARSSVAGAARAAELSLEEFVAALRGGDRRRRARRRRRLRYSLGAPLDQCYGGLQRYWAKRGGAVSTDRPAAAQRRARRRARRTLERDRAQRQPQHLRPRRLDARARDPGRHARPRLRASPSASTHGGLAIVWSGHREAAEHYWELLRAAGLTMAPLEQG